MSERDSDIEFDFFDEPETQEAADRVRLPRRPAGGGPGGPRRGVRAPSGLVPMLRLAGLIAFLILAVIVVVFLVRGCASSSKHATYSGYMNEVTKLAAASAQVGKQLNTVLTSTGIKESDLESRIRGFAAQQQQLANQASSIRPPGPLHTEHDHLIEVFQLRASGLGRLADAFGQTATASAKKSASSGRLLAEQARLLVASDVNWDFYFRDASKSVLQKQNVTGVQVPDSNFLANPDLASTNTMALLWQRLHGATTTGTPGGKHGSALVSVTALPDGKQLSTSTRTTITTSTDLAFRVAVMDSGNFQEFSVKVTLTIAATTNPIVKSKTISVINAGQTLNVTFTNIVIPSSVFATPTSVKVDIQPVPGETVVSNNTAEYPVIFSVG